MTDPIAGRITPPTDEVGGVDMRHAVARAKVNLTLEILGRRADGYHELRSLVAFTQFGDDLWLAPGRPFSLAIDGPFAGALDQPAFNRHRLNAEKAIVFKNLEHFPAKWIPVRVAKIRQDKELEPHSDSIGVEKALDPPSFNRTGVAPEGGNLIQMAAELYAQAASEGDHSDGAANSDAASGAAEPTGAFRLTKRIPVAAGLGGGSADAAAALRLLAGLPPEAPRLSALLPFAARLGADVSACLFSKPAIMTGIGERLHFLPRFPAVPVVLVNPRVPLATAAVFHELRAASVPERVPDAEAPAEFASLDDLIAHVRQSRNDLEPPARRLLPTVGTILDRLEASPGTLLARLSGSGPTCFALFRTQPEAEAAASDLRAEHPEWWIEATTLAP